MTRLVDDPLHRRWLDDQLAALVAFQEGTALPEGGFAWLDAVGRPDPDAVPELYLTARMTHTAALAMLKDLPGAEELAVHGVASLRGPFADAEHGGWRSRLGEVGRKQVYDHVHVGLAAASAQVVGIPGADALLDEVVAVIDTRLWDDDAQTLRESFAPDWSDEENYRGANANMHGVEAMLALGDVLGDARWHLRALTVADRLINGTARAHEWRLPEHYDRAWAPLPHYNADDRAHRFRPYGVTPGHAAEWARLCLQLYASPALGPPAWCVEAAQGLLGVVFERAWGADGHEGLPYTLDWDDSVITDLRLHWPVCEAIQAVATHDTVTGERRYEDWYARLWGHVRAHFLEASGTWRNELDAQLRPSETVWQGRPDVYHIAGAYVVPTLPASPFATLALAGEPSRLEGRS